MTFLRQIDFTGDFFLRDLLKAAEEEDVAFAWEGFEVVSNSRLRTSRPLERVFLEFADSIRYKLCDISKLGYVWI